LTKSQQAKMAEATRLFERANKHIGSSEPDKPEALVEQALALEREVRGEPTQRGLNWLGWLAERRERRGEFSSAEKLLRELEEVESRRWGANHWQAVDARWARLDCVKRASMSAEQRARLAEAARKSDESVRLFHDGKFAPATRRAREAAAIRKELLGKRHPLYAFSLNVVAMMRQSLGEHREALALYEEVLQITRGTLGEVHPSYAAVLNNLATFYQETGAFRRALPLYQQARQICNEALGKSHRDYARSLNNLAVLHKTLGQFKEALPLYLEAVEIDKVVLGEKHPDYATTLNNLGKLYQEMGEYHEAVSLIEKARALVKQSVGVKHPTYALNLHNLGILKLRLGEFRSALPLLEEALAIRKEVLGEKHTDCASSLAALAEYYTERGEYRRALLLSREALAIRKEILGESHPLYADSLNDLAHLYQKMGDYRAALPLYEQSLAITKQAPGEKHSSYAHSLNNLALLYNSMGEHHRAMRLCRQALEITREALGEKHPSYARSLSNLATLYRGRGDYREALSLSKKALNLTRETLGEKHPEYAIILNNLASLYADMADHVQALPLYLQVVAIEKETLGEKHPSYANGLNNLAGGYSHLGRRPEALALWRQALQIYEESLGKKHSTYASALGNLGYVYNQMKDYKSALRLYEQVLDLRKEVLGQRHPHYADSLNNLGELYRDMGDPKTAVPLLDRAAKIWKEVRGEQHPSFAWGLTNLAFAQAANRDLSRAVPLAGLALALTRHRLELLSATQSERQQLAAVAEMRYRLDVFLSVSASFPEMAAVSHTEVLALKGAVFARQQQARLAAGENSDVRALVESLQGVSRELTSLALNTPPPEAQARQRQRLEILTRQKEALEVQLAGQSESFRRQLQRLTSAELSGQLPADVALVDFLAYLHADDGIWQGSRLAAFVLRRDQRPVRLDLGPMHAVEKAISTWREAVQRGQPDPSAAGLALRKLLWQPLTRHLEGVNLVLISPDETLARFPFPALPGKKPDTFLLEEVGLASVPVPRLLPELLRRKADGRNAAPSLLVVGEVNFDGNGRSSGKDERIRAVPRDALRGWKPLPGTRVEIEAIQKRFLARHAGARVTDLRKDAATRSAIRRAASKHTHVHLATHGFFAPPALKSVLERPERTDCVDFFGKGGVSGWHPGLLSGIVLAGANLEAKAGQDEGILTALEVAETDLSKVRLAVLSACETGLGKEAGGESVLGLQRAFQVAGARSAITSLWNVDDAATSVLMEEFYRHLWAEKRVTKLEALRQAQLFVLNHPEAVEKRRRELIELLGAESVRGSLGKIAVKLPAGERKKRSHPLYWAGFVLSGDWR
jgi:CHAT domain-containing protein/tetratricopeptide (TPR) repeat protein